MAMVVETICGNFDFHRAQKLRRRTQTAQKKKEKEFKFQGAKMETKFASLLVELLELQFPLSSEDI